MVYFLSQRRNVVHKPDSIQSQTVMARTLLILTLLLPLSLPAALPAADGPHGTPNGVFAQFTRHIQAQIASDKAAFAQASGCTNWFYKQEQHKPAPFDVHPIRLDLILQSPTQDDCRRLYPGGLDAVRQDFHRTQSSLSVSLTAYEFALVVDRDDNTRYNREELRDLFQSLALAYDPAQSQTAQATVLTSQFDSWYRTRNLEKVMNGMSQLYEKGYRVTAADRAELERVTQ